MAWLDWRRQPYLDNEVLGVRVDDRGEGGSCHGSDVQRITRAAITVAERWQLAVAPQQLTADKRRWRFSLGLCVLGVVLEGTQRVHQRDT